MFFQISSAVYVWTQERYSFQMTRSHLDKMTSITTPDSKVKTYCNWVGRDSKRQTRHRLRSTWSPTSSNVPISDFRRRREDQCQAPCVVQKRVQKNMWVTEKSHIHRSDFRYLTDTQDTSSTRRCYEETQTWWSLWSHSSYTILIMNVVDKSFGWWLIMSLGVDIDERHNKYLDWTREDESICQSWECHIFYGTLWIYWVSFEREW